MSEHTWRELDRADMDAAAAHAVEMENRAGQDSGRTGELLPCPFCGGEAETSAERFERTLLSWVYCKECGAAGGYRHTEAEAIKAWNTRAGAYCAYAQPTDLTDGCALLELAERTCHDTGENDWHFVCSACGYEQNGYEQWSYCPNCGARVVDWKEGA